MIEPSTRLVKLIQGFESFSPTVYVCPGGAATIGYGTTVYPDGRPVAMGDAPITEETATQYLTDDLRKRLSFVCGLIYWRPELHVIEAVTSLAYNIGDEAFANSTCLKRLNDGKSSLAEVATAMQWWNKATDQKTGKKRVLGGLVARRKIESDLLQNGWDGTSSSATTIGSIQEVKPSLVNSRGVWGILFSASSAITPMLVLLWPEIQARMAGYDTNALGSMTPKQIVMSMAGVLGGSVLAVLFKRQDLHANPGRREV